ncbi:hypothetical protein [Chamaesiphon polymorphus]|uniref:hypothetical protein n=1 Tax=Chamaesiphon polymorphus TaxID=2107691 RepID=UPI0015E686FA|nr:hypothetical protein [Chamaesiphon polymorphus]
MRVRSYLDRLLIVPKYLTQIASGYVSGLTKCRSSFTHTRARYVMYRSIDLRFMAFLE